MSLASRDWNDMTSSSSEQANQNQQTVAKQLQFTADQKIESTQLPKETQPVIKQQKEDQSHTVNKKQAQRSEKKTAHLTDEQLLAKYLNKQVDDPRIIRVTACHRQQYKKILQDLPNVRVKEVKDGFYILNFQTQDGLIDFVKQKIEKKYRFYFLPYFKRKESAEYRSKEQGRYQNRDSNLRRQKKDYVLKGQRPNVIRVEEQKIQERQEEVQFQVETENKVAEKKTRKSTFVERQHFEVQNLMNILHIESELFDVDRAIRELQNKKVFKDFSKVVIKTPSQALKKVAKLCYEISHKKKFNLDRQPVLEGSVIELVLFENGKESQTKEFYQRYYGPLLDKNTEKDIKKTNEVKDLQEKKQSKESKPQKYQKEYKQQRHQRQQKEEPRANKQKKAEKKELQPSNEQVSCGRVLGSKFNEYFQNVSVNNLSTIVSGFDQNEYVKRLKDESANIEKNWNSWKVQAEDNNIQVLLKLVHRLKKSTIYNVQLLPSLRNEKAVLTAELRPRPEKERRPKVDVSGVNGYLS